MTQFRANKKLYALDESIHALAEEQRALEIQAFAAEAPEAERSARYLAIPDPDLRQKLTGVERTLQDLRRQQAAARIKYWTSVTHDTRDKLTDLNSPSPTSRWRRGVWFDVLTILWILVGAGWWGLGIPGALGGAAITAVWSRFIFPGREAARLTAIRRGEEILRSGESQLREAEEAAARIAAADMKKSESADKPGSVLDSHSSGTAVTSSL